MTIQQFVDSFPIEVDQLYVKDSRGRWTTAPGNQKFTNVEISYKANNTFADLVFTV